MMALLTGCETLGTTKDDARRILIDFECQQGATMEVEVTRDVTAGEETVTINPPMTGK